MDVYLNQNRRLVAGTELKAAGERKRGAHSLQQYNDQTRQIERADERQALRPFLRQYLEERGIDTTKNFRCISPEHDDKNPSMGYIKDSHRCYCRACRACYDIFDVVAMDMGISSNDRAVFEEVRKRYGQGFSFSPAASTGGGYTSSGSSYRPKQTASTQPRSSSGGNTGQPMGWDDVIIAETPPQEQPRTDYTEYFKKCQEQLGMTDYPQRRGLSQNLCRDFLIGYDPAWHHPKSKVVTPRLIIPTSRSSYTARDVRETMPDYQKPYKNQKVGRSFIFNLRALYSEHQTCIVVEGEIDALSIAQCGGNACALGSIANINLLLRILAQKNPPESLYLLLDNDKAGQDAQIQLARGLCDLHIPYAYNVEDLRIPDGMKDANDMLMKCPDHLKHIIERVRI